MKIFIKKINYHWWNPFITKEIILDVNGIEQPMCLGWDMYVKDEKYIIEVNYIDYDKR